MVITLAAVSADSVYLTRQISRLRALQTDLADRNRKDSLQLLRIQNDLNSLGLAMRDMLDSSEPYPLTAWSAQFQRIRARSRRRAAARRPKCAVGARTPEQRAVPRRLAGAVLGRGRPDLRAGAAAGTRTRRARRSGCRCRRGRPRSAPRSRGCWSRTTKAKRRPRARVQGIYDQVQRQVYWFLAATLAAIVDDQPVPDSIQPAAVRAAGVALGRAPRRRAAADHGARIDAAPHRPRAARRVRPDADGDGIDARPRRAATRPRIRRCAPSCAKSPRSRRRMLDNGARPVADAAPVDPRGGRASRARSTGISRPSSGRLGVAVSYERAGPSAAGRRDDRRFTSIASCRRR